ncbi:hypothetical protein [Streptomyces sp. NPDC001435]|uniref:hypothetical protein n=1 Tax=Streptomyces sp. NPDC001435 TaxID=3364576 RepID=UPI0036C7648A
MSASQDLEASVSGVTAPDVWPPQPAPLDTGSRGREDRLRMLRQMRSVWEENNRARHERIKKELAVAQARQAEVTAYWNHHKTTVVGRWDSRTGLLAEARVREWAVTAGLQLGAKGRVTGELWLDYSTNELAAGSQIKEAPDPLFGH